MIYNFLTNYSPKNSIRIDIGILLKWKRVGLVSKNQTTYYDGLSFVSEMAQDEHFFEALRNWIVFHSFTLNSIITLTRYQEEQFSKDECIIEGECAYQIDYLDIATEMYQSEIGGVKSLDYVDLYNLFLSTSDENKKIVRNYLTISELGGGMHTKRQITDTSYLRIVGYHSIVEKLLGVRPFCKVKHKCDCSDCEKDDIQHYSLTYKEWVKVRMGEIIHDLDVVEQYTDAISSIYTLIRNPAAHNSAFPSVSHISQESGTTVEYDLEKSKKEFLADKTALVALSLLIQEISRNLLFNSIYGINIFPPVHPLVSTSIKMKK